MIGNTLFYPGMTIWIDPKGFAGNDPNWDPRKGAKPSESIHASYANALGFGGYHIVTRVNSSIESGKYTTTVEAQFDYSGDGTLSGVAPNLAARNNSIKKKSSSVEVPTRSDQQTKCGGVVARVEREARQGRLDMGSPSITQRMNEGISQYEQSDFPPRRTSGDKRDNPSINRRKAFGKEGMKVVYKTAKNGQCPAGWEKQTIQPQVTSMDPYTYCQKTVPEDWVE